MVIIPLLSNTHAHTLLTWSNLFISPSPYILISMSTLIIGREGESRVEREVIYSMWHQLQNNKFREEVFDLLVS